MHIQMHQEHCQSGQTPGKARTKTYSLRALTLILVAWHCLAALSSQADTAYRYVDRDGVVCFTDDPSAIPKETRGQIDIRDFEEPKAFETTSPRSSQALRPVAASSPAPQPMKGKKSVLVYKYDGRRDLSTNLLGYDADVYHLLFGKRMDKSAIVGHVDAMVSDIKKDIAKARPKDAKGRIACLLDRLTLLGFSYQSIHDCETVILLKNTLETRKTNCAGFSQLCLVLAKPLGLSLHGVAIPCPRQGEFHMLTRYDDGKERFNIEATNRFRGLLFGDSRYMRTAGSWQSPYFFHNLDEREVVGDHLYSLYYLSCRHQKWELAEACAEQGFQLAPRSWWTNYMMSCVCFRRGDLEGARKHVQNMLDVGFMAPPDSLERLRINYPGNRWFN